MSNGALFSLILGVIAAAVAAVVVLIWTRQRRARAAGETKKLAPSEQARALQTLIDHVNGVCEQVAKTRAVLGTGSVDPAPDLETLIRLDAKVSAFASTEINKELKGFHTCVGDFVRIAHVLDDLEKQPLKQAEWKAQWDDEMAKLLIKRKASRARADALISNIKAELKSLPGGRAK